MLTSSEIKSISALINFTIYLYKKDDSDILMYNNAISKSTPIPAFFKDMISKNQSRKVIEKDGVKIVYHYFKLDNDYMIFFQDSLDDAKLAELMLVASNLEVSNSLTNEPDEDDSDENENTENTADDSVVAKYKHELIVAKSDQVKMRQEIRKRDTILNQYRSKLEYLANDLIIMQKLLREQNDTITALKATSTEYYAQVKKLSSGIDIANFNKLKEVNNALRQELTKANFVAKTSDDIAFKLKRNSTQAYHELMRLSKEETTTKMDLEIIANMLAKNEPVTVKDSTKQSEPFENVNIKSAINVLNDAIQSNDASGINLQLLSTIISLDIADTKKNPATTLSSIVGALINMAKNKKITQKHLDILCAATNLFKLD